MTEKEVKKLGSIIEGNAEVLGIFKKMVETLSLFVVDGKWFSHIYEYKRYEVCPKDKAKLSLIYNELAEKKFEDVKSIYDHLMEAEKTLMEFFDYAGIDGVPLPHPNNNDTDRYFSALLREKAEKLYDEIYPGEPLKYADDFHE
jgi:hypothetical protein